ncbi:hypothetical protein [Xanthomonas arboricola]|uniref:hypothetical protein n=1 Tax=Xanthomonas arboricola TaxID=56448 RepID=UPI001609A8B7|nr:hypothetical protein [Xanthomonas arboricola]MBB3761895.1 hypothetical protein [Xanthomonas arboricola]
MGGVYQPVEEEGNPLPMLDEGLEGLQLLSVVNYQDGAAGRLRGYRYSLVRNEAWGKLLSVRENMPGGKLDDRRPVQVLGVPDAKAATDHVDTSNAFDAGEAGV